MFNFKKAISLVLTMIFVLTLVSCSDDTTGSMIDSQESKEASLDASVSAESSEAEESKSDSEHDHDEGVTFVLDVKAVPSETESGVINAVISLSHTHLELLAIQFHLAFSSTSLEGIYKTPEELDKIMTSVPTYDSTYGVALPSFEQICVYNQSASLYECMFVDLLSYPSATSGQTIDGIKDAEDFVITIPFKVNADAKAGDTITFDLMEGTIGGTQKAAFSSVKGSGASVTYTLTEKDVAK